MSLNFLKLLLISFFAFSVHAKAESKNNDHLKWSGNIYKVIKDFEKVHRQFFKNSCRPGVEAEYYKLLRAYRGKGFYLPKLGDDIDRKAIINNLHHFRKKINYIERTITKLKSQKEYPRFSLLYVELDKIVQRLLSLKKKYHQSIRADKQKEIMVESNQELVRLKKHFDLFMKQVFFLKSYNFPNDYLAHRRKYESFKDKEGEYNKRKANDTFFLRRILEDGAYDKSHTRPDKYLRTTLDTLYLSIHKEKDFISENIRYDLDWIERGLERLVDRGRAVQIQRLEEWRDRTQNNYEFYKEIIKTKNKNKSRFLVKKENESSQKLKEYVYKKQAEVYDFWAKKSELHKALFSLETILVNEVGVLDGKFGLERTSVAEVVLNRYEDKFYSELEKDQMIYDYISKDVDKAKEKWLNVLFKIGEFSFTYHYIPAVVKTFCPDMSPRGKSIRSDNLKLSLKAMKNHNNSFNAFRYFSRVSMLGKIDMSTVWTDYVRLPEMVGFESIGQRKLARYYLSDKYQYLYSFLDARKLEYTVVRVKGKTYSMRWIKGKPVFFDYRNPHLFAYFSKK